MSWTWKTDRGAGLITTKAVRPQISVVIPTFNRLERLKRVLGALAVQTLDSQLFETIVVSDGSTDGTDEYLDGPTPVPLVHARQDNAGPAAARNHGVGVARARLVLFIDDDVVASPTLLERHVQRHGDSDSTVVVGPMLNAPGYEYSAWVAWEQAMLDKQYRAMRMGAYPATFRQFYTGNASLGRALFEKAGGFDTAFRRAEDVELAFRLDGCGASFVFEEEAVAYHFAERSFDSWLAAAQAYGRNDVLFARDHGQEWLLPTLVAEFQHRNVITRRLVLASLGHRRLGASAAKTLRWLGVATRRAARISRACLSGLYALAYYLGAADEFGDVKVFRSALRHARRDEPAHPGSGST